MSTTRASHSPARSARVAGRNRASAGATRGPGPDEEAVAGVERDVREHELGLEGEEELQRLVIAQLAGGADDHRDHRVLEGGLGVACVADAGRETCGLASDGDPHQLPLAAEVAVERGPGASGLAGDVVEGRLGETVAGDAGECGADRRALRSWERGSGPRRSR